jgi:hypothetical protein
MVVSADAYSGVQGAVANFVETEQLVELRASQGKETIVSSFVQVLPVSVCFYCTSWPSFPLCELPCTTNASSMLPASVPSAHAKQACQEGV